MIEIVACKSNIKEVFGGVGVRRVV